MSGMAHAKANTPISGTSMRHACPGETRSVAPALVASSPTPISDPAARRRAKQALRRGEQRDDEQREHRHRGKDAAHQERGGLLEQAQYEAANDRAAVVAQAAERDRNEAVEV